MDRGGDRGGVEVSGVEPKHGGAGAERVGGFRVVPDFGCGAVGLVLVAVVGAPGVEASGDAGRVAGEDDGEVGRVGVGIEVPQ